MGGGGVHRQKESGLGNSLEEFGKRGWGIEVDIVDA
jgi:hypothetical protein